MEEVVCLVGSYIQVSSRTEVEVAPPVFPTGIHYPFGLDSRSIPAETAVLENYIFLGIHRQTYGVIPVIDEYCADKLTARSALQIVENLPAVTFGRFARIELDRAAHFVVVAADIGAEAPRVRQEDSHDWHAPLRGSLRSGSGACGHQERHEEEYGENRQPPYACTRSSSFVPPSHDGRSYMHFCAFRAQPLFVERGDSGRPGVCRLRILGGAQSASTHLHEYGSDDCSQQVPVVAMRATA
jgi:hypothetical protein